MFCAQCGSRLPEHARFCDECGAPAPMPAQGGRRAAVAPYAPADGPAYYGHTGPGYAPGGQAIAFNPTINVTVAAPQQAPAMAVASGDRDLPLALRVLWFLLIGLWFGLLWIVLAWLLNLTIIGLPIGLAMLNQVPQVMTLQSNQPRTTYVVTGPASYVTLSSGASQLPLALRALYFLIVGIWFSLVWCTLAWLAAATIIGLPLAFWMFNRVPLVTTLRVH